MSEKENQISQDDLDLNYYEGIRKGLVQRLASDDKIHEDTDKASLLLRALDGGSRTILTKKRLDVDKETNATQTQHQALLAELLIATPTARQRADRREALPEIPATAPVPGETDMGTKELKYKDFMAKDHESKA